MHPQFIDPNCPECGTALVLADMLDDPDCDNPWTDEWACPNCYDGDGIYVDFEPEQKAELDRRMKAVEDGTAETIPWEEARKKLYKSLDLDENEIEERKREAEFKNKNSNFHSIKTILNFK